MFYYLKGIITVLDSYMAVVDCGGVGYACHTTAYTQSSLKIGEAAMLYTFCNIREDAFDIFGFSTQQELDAFKMLIGISGVGPKAALAILSSNSPSDLAAAVATENEKALMAAPGIGKKLAQRILLELKDKMNGELAAVGGGGAWLPSASSGGAKANEVSSALTVLGYSPAEISSALKGVDMDKLSVEDAIKLVLKNTLK